MGGSGGDGVIIQLSAAQLEFGLAVLGNKILLNFIVPVKLVYKTCILPGFSLA